MGFGGTDRQQGIDQRGRPCGLVLDLRHPPSIFPMRRPDVPLGRPTVLRLRIALGLTIAALLLLTLLVPLTIFGVRGTIRPWLGTALFYGFLGMSGLFIAARVATVVSRAHWRSEGRTRAAMLLAARGQCAACGGWLLTTARDADGLTTCPGCSAAWKVGNEGGCPGCGYDMSQVPATAGPLAICPECATLSAATST
ncbi:MAG: hypothetical protein ACIAQU_00375 [Phycisphaerales bacterium JB064]